MIRIARTHTTPSPLFFALHFPVHEILPSVYATRSKRVTRMFRTRNKQKDRDDRVSYTSGLVAQQPCLPCADYPGRMNAPASMRQICDPFTSDDETQQKPVDVGVIEGCASDVTYDQRVNAYSSTTREGAIFRLVIFFTQCFSLLELANLLSAPYGWSESRPSAAFENMAATLTKQTCMINRSMSFLVSVTITRGDS
jgi:hypothetical protein